MQKDSCCLQWHLCSGGWGEAEQTQVERIVFNTIKSCTSVGCFLRGFQMTLQTWTFDGALEIQNSCFMGNDDNSEFGFVLNWNENKYFPIFYEMEILKQLDF